MHAGSTKAFFGRDPDFNSQKSAPNNVLTHRAIFDNNGELNVPLTIALSNLIRLLKVIVPKMAR